MALTATSLVRRYARALAAAGVLALLAACGGGGGGGDGEDTPPAADPEAVQLEGASAATATIGAAGGELSAAASDGRRYTLTVPAGALAADTVITATPVRSMGNAPLAAGLKAAVRFGPSGLRFAVPARLRIEGAAAPTTLGKRLVGFVRADDGSTMNLQLPARAAAALDLQVQHFSDAGVTEGSLAELALVPIVTPASVADEIFEAATRELPPPAEGAQALADVFAALHDRIVRRELDDATRVGTPEARLVAATAFGIWDRAIELGTADDAQYAAVVALLGDRHVLSRARAVHGWAAGDEAGAVQACLDAAVHDAARGLHAAAEALLAQALQRLAPDSERRAALRAQRARLWLQVNRPDAAWAEAAAVLQAFPGPAERAQALTVQAGVALQQGRVAEALPLALAALQSVPDDEDAGMLHLRALHALGRFPEAEALLRERLALLRTQAPGPRCVAGLTSLANLLDFQGRHGEALPLHEEALAMARHLGLRYSEVEAALNLVWCLPELGREAEAIAVGEAALALGDYDATPTLANNLAYLYLQTGRQDEAAVLYQRLAEDLDPTLACVSRAKLLQIQAQRAPADVAGRLTAAEAVLAAVARTDHAQAHAIAVLALLDHGPADLHAVALRHVPQAEVDATLRARLQAAVARVSSGSGA